MKDNVMEKIKKLDEQRQKSSKQCRDLFNAATKFLNPDNFDKKKAMKLIDKSLVRVKEEIKTIDKILDYIQSRKKKEKQNERQTHYSS